MFQGDLTGLLKIQKYILLWKKFQKELLGFFIPTENYLCLNGDEYALESGSNVFEKYSKEK